MAWCILRATSDHMAGTRVTIEVLRDIAERLLCGDSAGCLPGESDYEAPPSPPDDFTPVA